MLFCLVFLWYGTASAVGVGPSSGNQTAIKGTVASEITPMALSATQKVAVLRYGDGTLHTVHPGQALNDSSLTLKAVLADRIVVTEAVAGQGENTLWIFKPTKGATQAPMQRFSTQHPASDAHQVFITRQIPISLPSKKAKADKGRATTHSARGTK